MALVGDDYEYFDKAFYDLTVPIAAVEELYSGCRWADGAGLVQRTCQPNLE